MNETWDAFFGNTKVLRVSAVLALLGTLYFGIQTMVTGAVGLGLAAIVVALLNVMGLSAYQIHEKRVMQLCMGAVLAALIQLLAIVAFPKTGVELIGSIRTINVIGFVLIFCFFLNNLALASTHHTSKGRILINQFIALVLIVLYVTGIVFGLINASFDNSALSLGILCEVIFVCALESKLNIYKEIRDAKTAAGEWTEEEKQKAKEEVFSDK